MIQQGTIIHIIDNSGVKSVKFIKFVGAASKKKGFIGSITKASVSALGISKARGSVLCKGTLVYCYVVTSQLMIKRRTGENIRFSKNCGLIIDKHFLPTATKAIGCSIKEFRDKKSLKTLSTLSSVL